MERKRLAVYVLGAGLIIVFAWFGIDKFRNAYLWVGFLPSWIDGALGMSKNVWIRVIGAFEILLAVMLAVPYRPVRQAAAALMALHLAGILTQVGINNDVGIRDIGLTMMSAGLFILL